METQRQKRIENEIKLIEGILEIYKETRENNPEFKEFDMYVSAVMAYGWEIKEVYAIAEKYGITIDPDESDPDDEFDDYGSLEVDPHNMQGLRKAKKELKEELKRLKNN